MRLPQLADRHVATLREAVATYRTTVAEFVRRGQLLRLTSQPLRRGRGQRCPAFQLSDGERSLVLAVWLGDAAVADSPTGAVPRGLDPARLYSVSEPGTGADRFTIRGGEALPAVEQRGRLASRLFLIEPA